MAKNVNWSLAKFVGAWPQSDLLPKPWLCEIAFVGRSNVGKSSLINALCQKAKLAKVSSTPGKTQAFVLFEVEDRARLVDLPGYGYAKVPLELKQQWSQIAAYLQERASLILLLIDIRHGLQELDYSFVQWAKSLKLTIEVVLTKADKLSKNQCQSQVAQIKKQFNSDIKLHLSSQQDPQTILNLQNALSEHTLLQLQTRPRKSS